MKRQLTVFTFLILLLHSSFAQKEKNNNGNQPSAKGKNEGKFLLQSAIKVIAKAYGDSIVLRWAPSKPWAWHKLNFAGYTIERIDITDKDTVSKLLLTREPLKPYTLEKFKTVFKSENNNAAIAAQCLYGNNFDTNLRKGQAAIQDRASVSDARYTYTLMVSDYDAKVGEATALRFSDKSVKKARKYFYRVMPAAAVTQGTIDTGMVLVINNRAELLGKPEITEGLAFDHLSELHWSRTGGEVWSGYYIERSDDGKTFTALNVLPFISSPPDSAMLKEDSSKARLFSMLQTSHIYIDSLPKNYKNYSYRIRAVNAFAEISGYSNIITVSGRDMTAPVAVNMLNPKFISNRSIKVSWKKDLVEADCKGYYVTRSNNINGPYETLNQQLLAPGISEYIDNNAYAHGSSFYIVVVVDTANNISSSVPGMGLVPDVTPPAVPTGLKGRIEKNGLVYLSWDANKEEDIKGYKVYFANAADHVFTQVTTDANPIASFVDSITLRTLTKDIWYKIAAVDYNNNHSEFSPSLKLRKPDIVPPMPPVPQNIYVDSSGVVIDFLNSSSEDVAAYVVYRREEKGEWKLMGRQKNDTTQKGFHFADKETNHFVSYQYSAEAIDGDSLHSEKSIPVNAAIRSSIELPAIGSLKVLYNTKTKTAKLQWDYKKQGEYFFIIFKSAGNGGFIKYRSVPGDKSEWTDNLLAQKGTVKYSIQAIWRGAGQQTKLSEPVQINIVN